MASNVTQMIDHLLLIFDIDPSKKRLKNYSVEICVDSVESAYNAYLGGADRIELCSSLIEGGLTPSIGTIIEVLRCAPNIDVHIMLRPRSGDFFYNQHEMNVILNDIDQIIQLKESQKYPNLKGIVSGFLDIFGNIDTKKLSLCLDKIKEKELEFTYHRAFDLSVDAIKSLKTCIKFGVHRILTSGLQPNVIEGLECIHSMIKYKNDNYPDSELKIAIGGGVKLENIGTLINVQNKAMKHIHGTFRKIKKGNMEYRKSNIYMGAKTVNGARINEYENKYANVEIIKQIVKYMGKIHA